MPTKRKVKFCQCGISRAYPIDGDFQTGKKFKCLDCGLLKKPEKKPIGIALNSAKKGGIVNVQLLHELPVCDDCGKTLPRAVSEDRGGGHSELVIYCPCGSTYTN